MEPKEIEKLLNRYLEGESTLEEEGLLKEYFAQPGIHGEHSEMKELFTYLLVARQESEPHFDITNALNAVVENEWKKVSEQRFRRIYAWIGSAAAVLVLSFGTFHYLNKAEPQVKDSFKDPKLAYLETKQALMMVSKVMNHNTAKLRYLSKVDESFSQVQKIAQIENIVNSVKK
ncbi:MAG: hypothetical protein WCR72_15345 [Bacteroidota bacterium]